MVTLVDQNQSFSSYRLFYELDGEWHEIPVRPQSGKVKVHRFDEVWGNRVKVTFTPTAESMSLHEIGVYYERRD